MSLLTFLLSRFLLYAFSKWGQCILLPWYFSSRPIALSFIHETYPWRVGYQLVCRALSSVGLLALGELHPLCLGEELKSVSPDPWCLEDLLSLLALLLSLGLPALALAALLGGGLTHFTAPGLGLSSAITVLLEFLCYLVLIYISGKLGSRLAVSLISAWEINGCLSRREVRMVVIAVVQVLEGRCPTDVAHNDAARR